ncbi:YciI-like protein [Arthrobacter sp. CC3]|uniref:YciI-like protein n=1 Tax=Arthrobacter sp. CC3 TaxID=3029185 RepID=UPI003266DAA1
MHAVLEYTFADNYLESREAYRGVHLKAAWQAVERGELLLGGAVGDGPFTGLLIFIGEKALETAQAVAAADPYVTGGVVTSWTARAWTTVVGDEAVTPIRP